MESDGDDITGRWVLFLDNPKEHLLLKYHALKDCIIVPVPKDSKSMLDICGVRVKEKKSVMPWFV
jgi:hypothetical protein